MTGTFNKSAIKADLRATQQYAEMRENSKLPVIESIGPATARNLIFTLLNIRSFQKHQNDLIKDKPLLESDILCLTETQLTSDIEFLEILRQFEIIQNNSVDRFSSLMVGCKKSCVRVVNRTSIPGAILFEIIKSTFASFPIKVLLIYRKNFYDRENSLHLIQHFSNELDSHIDIILGDMNINAFDDNNNYFAHYLTDYQQVVKDPTHISGSLIDHIYVHNNMLNLMNVSIIIKNVYYSDHDAVQLKIFPN